MAGYGGGEHEAHRRARRAGPRAGPALKLAVICKLRWEMAGDQVYLLGGYLSAPPWMQYLVLVLIPHAPANAKK